MDNLKIYQAQGIKRAHYVLSKNKTQAIRACKIIYPVENIDSAVDVTANYTRKEIKNLPDYIITASEFL